MAKLHRYTIDVRWTGNRGSGTSTYRDYDRNHEIAADGKTTIAGSSDPSFRGDATRWNPEELFLASISACHKLWYLHLCAEAGVIVTDYIDRAEAWMNEDASGTGRFTRVLLHPETTIASADQTELATNLHDKAHEMCFIANTVACPIGHAPTIVVASSAPVSE